MPEAATTEFWRDIKPVPNSFKPGVLPEVYMKDPANSDPRYFVPVSETVSSRPIWISPQRNMWADVLMSEHAGLVNRHYHPHHIFAFTLSGKWGYLEHDWTATKGDFVYETPGESHTLVAYEHKDTMRVLFIVTGPLIWLDDDGKPDGYFDVHQYIAMCRAHYEKVGLGVELINKLFR